MKKRNIILGGLLALSLAATAGAGDSNYAASGVGGSELKLPMGARPIGMGEAFAGKADDVNALAWNPSGLAQLKGQQAGFMHSLYLQEVGLDYLAYGGQLWEGAGFGVNLSVLNFGTLDRTDEVNGLPSVVGQYSPMAVSGALGYGQWLLPEVLAVGGALKLLVEKIDATSYTAVAADLGALYRTGIDKLQVGLAVQNLGTPIASKTLPMNVKAGVAYGLPLLIGQQDAWNVLMDLNLPVSAADNFSVQFGTEYVFNQQAALRLGYKVKDSGEIGGLSGLTAGIGYKVKMLDLDYALVTYGDLGLTHQVMAAVHF